MWDALRSISIETLLLIGLFAASLFNAAMALRSRQRDRAATAVVRRVDAVLTVWAEHWGEPPEIVRPLLLQALQGASTGFTGPSMERKSV